MSRLGPPSASASSSSSARMSTSMRSSLSSRNPETLSTCTGNEKETEKKSLLITKEGRPYLNGMDGPFIYPLPVDLTETNRHIMLALLTSAVFETPLLSPELLQKPARRVLEVGCDSGYWSAVCHRYFQSKGHQVSFIGVDIKPPAGGTSECYKGMGMDWEYIQYDLREPGWPVQDGSVDLVMSRNLALVFNQSGYSRASSEFVRVLRPGGTLEVWEHDFTIRSVSPHAQAGDNGEELAHLGVYPVGTTAALGPSVNPYVVDYNIWLKSALEDLDLTPIPTALTVSLLAGCLIEGADALEGMIGKRLAVPLTALKWEREDGQKMVLTNAQAAIRQTAMDSFIGMVEAFEPMLRKSNRKNDDEWQEWLERAKRDWIQRNGLSFGECLEIGALSLRKKKD
ncbi:hypothetical protein FJTKL_12669 [Diaporthe vaccinii]|uniref:Methyltransferase domain-containing protein n=1 Tax=Diaporthe vaccinii TaxID=105482 RepID=A0ABR4ECM9_9PEZI